MRTCIWRRMRLGGQPARNTGTDSCRKARATCNEQCDTIAILNDVKKKTMDNSVRLLVNGEKRTDEEVIKCKCVLLGDGAVGKTSLTVSYTTNGYPAEYIPTAFDNYTVLVRVDNKPVQVELCDTAGQDDFDTLRPLCYPDTDVFLLCFSVVSPTSFHNISEKWVPEIRKTCPKKPLILIGTQNDLRNDVKVLIELAKHKQRPINESAARHLASHIGAECYVECSALTQYNLKDVFDAAIFTALKHSNDSSPHCPTKRHKDSSRRKGKSKRRHVHDSNNAPSTLPTPGASLRIKKPAWTKLCCFIR